MEVIDENQKKAVESDLNIPLMVFAGAGSGKTRILVKRVLFLLKNKCEPEKILILSFSKKSCEELKKRLFSLISNSANLIKILTFHQLAYSMIKDNKFILDFQTKEIKVISIKEQKAIIKQIILENNFGIVKIWNTLSLINKMKSLFDQNSFSLMEKEILEKYNLKLIEKKFIDYNDFFIYSRKLLTQYPKIRDLYSKLYEYIFIDEFQDTSDFNLEIIISLLNKNSKISIFGDPNQSIYSFRGANVSNIKKILDFFPIIQKIYLNQNFRSTSEIVKLANKLIPESSENNFSIIDSKNSVLIKELNDSIFEAKFICDEIEKMVYPGSKIQLRDISIIFRLKKCSSEIELELYRRCIPFKHKKGIPFYQRKETKELLNFMKLILSNYYHQFDSFEILKSFFVSIGINFEINFINSKFSSLNHFLKDFNSTNFNLPKKKSSFLNSIILKIKEVIKEIESEKNPIKQFELLVNCFLSFNLDNIDENFEEFDDFKSEIMIKRKELYLLLLNHLKINSKKSLFDIISFFENKFHDEFNENKINLSTIHQMKGLESQILFLIRVNEGFLPMDNSFFEEEKRIFYVGITRAIKKLYITYVKFYKEQPIKISPFLEFLEKN